MCGEHIIGWTAHYVIGTAFAALLIGIGGLAWVQEQTSGPALLVGVSTLAAPLLLMQPGMGAGIDASRTPRPASAPLHSLITHALFGLGLYATSLVEHLILLNIKLNAQNIYILMIGQSNQKNV